MDLFHHITVLSLSEDEKRLLLEAGVEFTDVRKSAQGESVSFVMGESDPRYERVAGLLRSLGKERFREFSMTVPTLQEFIEKVLRPSAERLKQEGYFATQAKWEYGREVMQQSLEFLKKGQREQALQLLDAAIAEAIQNNHSGWVLALCHHAEAIALSMRDRQRQIHYKEQALPFAKDYHFAAYNLAQLLLSDGQVGLAERYASEAYRQSMTQTTEADSDLRAAILRQWPNAAQSA
jgi:hypothetical protein